MTRYLPILMLLLVAACGGSGGAPPPPVVGPDTDPETRVHRMALTPFARETSAAADQFARDYVLLHGDMLAFHFDNLPIGLPWLALSGGTVPAAFADWFDPLVDLAAIAPVGTPRYVAASPLDITRTTVAPATGGGPYPPALGPAEFDNATLIAAYLAYCEFLVSTFDPDYLAIVVEANLYALEGDADFARLVALYTAVYDALKVAHPDLEVFATFQAEFMHGLDQWSILPQFAGRLDRVGISLYPSLGGGFEPSAIPADWLSRFATETGVPPVVTETGYGSEPFADAASNIDAPGSDALQEAYVTWLLDEADARSMDFVVWFFPSDLQGDLALLAPEFSALGLVRADLTSKPAEAAWDAILARPLQP